MWPAPSDGAPSFLEFKIRKKNKTQMADRDVPHLSQQLLTKIFFTISIFFLQMCHGEGQAHFFFWRKMQSVNANQSGRQLTSLLQPDFCVQGHVCPRSGRSRSEQSLFQNYTCCEQLCVCGLCVCTVIAIRTGTKGFCFSQVQERSSSAQSRWVDFKK